jgi:hypothetical protein
MAATQQKPTSRNETQSTPATQLREALGEYFFRRKLAEEHRKLRNNRFSKHIESITVVFPADHEPFFEVQVTDTLAEYELKDFVGDANISHYVAIESAV